MNAPALATNLWSTILWLILIILIVLLIIYLIWLFTRKRRKEEVGRPAAPPQPVAAPPTPAPQPTVAPSVEAAPAAPAEAVPTPAATAEAAPADDLTRLEGIGPKVAKVLASIGITTFKALAEADYSRVKQALVDAGWPYMDPAGWIEQAKLAAEGRWEELSLLQDRLKGGRQQ